MPFPFSAPHDVHLLLMAARTVSGVKGIRLMRAPAALKIAFPTAGASGGTPGSPIHPIFSLLSTIWTLISG